MNKTHLIQFNVSGTPHFIAISSEEAAIYKPSGIDVCIWRPKQKEKAKTKGIEAMLQRLGDKFLPPMGDDNW